MDLGLRDRLCVVVGASRGLGAATASVLAGEGAALLLVARNAEKLEAVATAVRDAGAPRVDVLAVDVTAPDAGDRVLAATGEQTPWALVNNAGATRRAALTEITDDEWQAQWDLHVMAPMRLMRALAPRMAEAGGGRIVNVGSSSGRRPSSNNAAYSVTKSALFSLSRTFADAFAARGVLVNSVAPGPIANEMWLGEDGLAAQIAAATGQTPDDVLAATAARLPIGRLGAEAEVAKVIAFLCSVAASNVAGAAWAVDGGAVPTNT
jgi:NAD(P)-dependent dehydrogenase (short-subunit alcohol dehydrogenase family)